MPAQRERICLQDIDRLRFEHPAKIEKIVAIFPCRYLHAGGAPVAQ